METWHNDYKAAVHLRGAIWSQPTVTGLWLAAHLVLSVCLTQELLAQEEPTPSTPYDFAIKRVFLENLWAQRTFLPSFRIDMQHRSDIKSLSKDCEVPYRR